MCAVQLRTIIRTLSIGNNDVSDVLLDSNDVDDVVVDDDDDDVVGASVGVNAVVDAVVNMVVPTVELTGFRVVVRPKTDGDSSFTNRNASSCANMYRDVVRFDMSYINKLIDGRFFIN